MTQALSPMSGNNPAPSSPAPLGGPTPPPDSAPWSDTDLGLEASKQAATAPMPLSAGQGADKLPTIGHIGRYALKYKIGEGGLGTVYAAHDPLLSRLIAIKTLNVEMSAEERDSFNALFLNEARAAAGLSHPHIVTVFDAGLADQGAYIAMELLKGRDLRQLRLEGWRPSPTQAATIVRRVADALAYAHSKGVVHRDVKPANIFMVGRTQPRVLDFGIARVAHQHDALAEGEMVGGSPYYMSPEQVRQQPVDRRCDVFSLGVVLYELLTETRPFSGSNLVEITTAVVEHQPPPPHEVNPAVPRALSEIAMRAIEKNPDDRYRSARALGRELRHWLEEHPQDADATEESATAPRRKLWWAAGTVALLVLSAVVWWGFSPSDDPSVAATPAVAASAVALAAPASIALPASAVLPAADAASAIGALASVDAAALAASTVASEPAVVLTASAGATSPAVEPPAAAGRQATNALDVNKTAGKEAPREASKDALKEASKETPKEPTKETAKERRARETRERASARLAAGTAPAAVAATGVVRLAVSPWGNVEVDGRAAGTTPPLTELTLSEGRHNITIRNDDFPPHSATVNVSPGQAVSIKHRFGS